MTFGTVISLNKPITGVDTLPKPDDVDNMGGPAVVENHTDSGIEDTDMDSPALQANLYQDWDCSPDGLCGFSPEEHVVQYNTTLDSKKLKQQINTEPIKRTLNQPKLVVKKRKTSLTDWSKYSPDGLVGFI